MEQGLKIALTPVGQLLSETWRIYKSQFKNFVIIHLYYYKLVILAALPGIIGYLFYLWKGRAMDIIDTDTPLGIILLIIIALYLLFFAVYFIFTSFWLELVVINRARNHAQPFELKKEYKEARHMVKGFLWTTFIVALFSVLLLLALVIPGIIFIIYWILVSYIYTEGKYKGYQAAKKSKEYVKGYWWDIFGRLIIAMLICFLVYIILGLFFVPLPEKLGENISSTIANLLITPFVTIYMWLIYEKLKQIKPDLS